MDAPYVHLQSASSGGLQTRYRVEFLLTQDAEAQLVASDGSVVTRWFGPPLGVSRVVNVRDHRPDLVARIVRTG